MTFSNIKQIVVPEGAVKKITYNGATLWERISRYLKTVIGKVVTVTDALNEPAESLKVTLEPIQSGSGTPSPDNVRPISGHTECVTEVCGVNVWDEEWEVGGISNDTGEMISSSNAIRSKNFISVVPQTSYYIAGLSSGILRPMFYDADKNFIGAGYWAGGTSNNPQSTPSGCYYMKFKLTASYGATYKNDISINYPSTDHDYHAYDGNTYTTTLGRTVYGGTLDVVSGELVVDRAIEVFDGSETWTKDGDLSGYHRFFVDNNDIKKRTDYAGHIVSNTCEAVNNYAYFGGFSGEMAVTAYSITTNQFNYLYLISKSLSSVADVKAYLASNPLQVVYELATPQTYQLTPQTISLLHGNNNVWSDGEVEMVYNADVQLWVLKQLGTSGTRTLSMTRTLAKSEDTDDTKSVQLAED